MIKLTGALVALTMMAGCANISQQDYPVFTQLTEQQTNDKVRELTTQMQQLGNLAIAVAQIGENMGRTAAMPSVCADLYGTFSAEDERKGQAFLMLHISKFSQEMEVDQKLVEGVVQIMYTKYLEYLANAAPSPATCDKLFESFNDIVNNGKSA